MKTLLIVVGLALLLACLVLLRWRRDKPAAETVAGAPDGSFVVQVETPLFSLRPPWEIPRALFGDRDRDLRFGHMSPGASFGIVAPNRLELSADGGWDLLIETDGEGRVAPGTRLIFPIVLGGRNLKFNCRPNSATGHFSTTPRAGSDKLDGSFTLKLVECKNAVSGKNTAGLPVFTVTGSFKGLPQTAKTKDESERMK